MLTSIRTTKRGRALVWGGFALVLMVAPLVSDTSTVGAAIHDWPGEGRIDARPRRSALEIAAQEPAHPQGAEQTRQDEHQ